MMFDRCLCASIKEQWATTIAVNVDPTDVSQSFSRVVCGSMLNIAFVCAADMDLRYGGDQVFDGN